MRLFIAINFEENIKNKIEELINNVRPLISKGRFVNKNHIHLTLEFLGETDESRIQDIKSSMDRINYSSFNLQLEKLGSFKKRNGDIFWLGIKNNNILLRLQNEIHRYLIIKDFKLENRKYTPHITVGRDIKSDNFDFNIFSEYIENLNIKVSSIDLMESKYIDKKLVHTIIYTKVLI